MSGGIVMTAPASHSPRIGVEAQAPDFLRGVIAGEYGPSSGAGHSNIGLAVA